MGVSWNEGLMNEIERAIEFFKNDSSKVHFEDPTHLLEYTESAQTALKLLRAELSRQENAPLTCNGCEWQPKMMGITRCNKCKRFTLLDDRYEPKGEPPCTQD